MTALYPAQMMFLLSRMASWAWNRVAVWTGRDEEERTYPGWTSSSLMPLRRSLTLSPE
jgi:hypothetical protein